MRKSACIRVSKLLLFAVFYPLATNPSSSTCAFYPVIFVLSILLDQFMAYRITIFSSHNWLCTFGRTAFLMFSEEYEKDFVEERPHKA